MSTFWKYFHDRLRWPQIFQPGPLSAVVRGLALHMDDVREDILWLRRQWNPATADDDMIVRYGESRGIIRWQFDTDESYRRRVVNAFAWHKLGGKVRGLERIFAENLFDAQVLPASRAELWAHFRLGIDVTGSIFDEQLCSLVFMLANEYKPARSVLEEVMTKSTNPLPVHAALAGMGRTQTRTRIFIPVPEPVRIPIYAGLARHERTRVVTRLCSPVPGSVRTPVHPALAAMGRTLATMRPASPVPTPVRLPVRIGLPRFTRTRLASRPAFPVPDPVSLRFRAGMGCVVFTRSRIRVLCPPSFPVPVSGTAGLATKSYTRSSVCPMN